MQKAIGAYLAASRSEIPETDKAIAYVAMLWREYVLSDDPLSGDAKELRERLIKAFPQREVVHRWQPMDTVPKKEDEVFLVRLPGNDVCKTLAIQVSVFEGRMYPDCKDGLIDWDDAIVGADAWSPLPTEIEGEQS